MSDVGVTTNVHFDAEHIKIEAYERGTANILLFQAGAYSGAALFPRDRAALEALRDKITEALALDLEPAR